MDYYSAILRELPNLRRYAALLTGSVPAGDACLKAGLELLVMEPGWIEGMELRLGLRRLVHLAWRQPAAEEPPPRGCSVEAGLRALPGELRAALLLVHLEGLDYHEAATILGVDEDEVLRRCAAARQRLAAITAPPVLVVEDDAVIAEDIRGIVETLGHWVCGTAGSHAEAVDAVARFKPGLLLVDLKLRGGGSGLHLVREVRATSTAPAIFITAYPERVRAQADVDARTQLVPKPFHPEMLKFAIRSALGGAGALAGGLRA